MAYSWLDKKLEYLGRIWKLRYFWMSLVKMDLQNRYRHSLLGIGWSLARPLAMTAVLCVVFGNLFKAQVKDYVPFLLTGMAVWQFLVEAGLQGCGSFLAGRAYIRQQPIPLAIFPLRTVLGAGIHALIALTLAVSFALVFGKSLHFLALLSLLPSFVLIFFIAWFLAILLGLIHAYFPDTGHLMEIFFQILFYITPVMYYPEMLHSRQRFAWLVYLNPFSHVLELVRQPILKGTIASLETYGLVLIFLLLLAFLSLACLKKLERNLVFWV